MSEKNAIFTVGQKALIEYQGKLLVMWSERYGIDFPGGRIKDGEKDLVASLKREVMEETGLMIEVGKPFICWTFPIPHGETEEIFTVGYLCTATSFEVTLSHEHDGYEWVDKESYRKLLYKVKYDIDAEILKKYFTSREY